MTNAVFRRKFIALNISQLSTQLKKSGEEGFPGGPVVWNSPCKTGGASSIPDQGRSHMSWGN